MIEDDEKKVSKTKVKKEAKISPAKMHRPSKSNTVAIASNKSKKKEIEVKNAPPSSDDNNSDDDDIDSSCGESLLMDKRSNSTGNDLSLINKENIGSSMKDDKILG